MALSKIVNDDGIEKQKPSIYPEHLRIREPQQCANRMYALVQKLREGISREIIARLPPHGEKSIEIRFLYKEPSKDEPTLSFAPTAGKNTSRLFIYIEIVTNGKSACWHEYVFCDPSDEFACDSTGKPQSYWEFGDTKLYYTYFETFPGGNMCIPEKQNVVPPMAFDEALKVLLAN